MNNRCYIRGLTLLGLFNTVIGCLFNRVLVRMIDTDTRLTVRWYWDKADCHEKETTKERVYRKP